MNGKTLSIALTGSGGSGVVTMGLLLIKAIARAGFYGLMNRSSGPQIRGGESAVMLRLGTGPVYCQDDSYHLLVALDWLNFSRFADEIPLTEGSIVIYEAATETIPDEIIRSGAQLYPVNLKQLAKPITRGRPNMIALGIIAGLLGIERQATADIVDKLLGNKGEDVVSTSIDCIHAGYEAVPSGIEIPGLEAHPGNVKRWNMTGNEAAGLGALRGGVRLVAAYPITPATEVLEWLAPNLEKIGGALIQAEDELASINMVIGASFGGVPALTATSGPGLSLMMEAAGLAVASETPVVIINVMRGGPSTGIPTKSEQADLNIALYGMHGDAPHLVLAPLDVRDCVFTTEWSVRLAERLQAVAIVLSDQFQGQASMVTDAPVDAPQPGERSVFKGASAYYQRYALTEDGISAMAIPGTAGCIYTADGLEHSVSGMPSSMAADHRQQMDKRLHKLLQFDYGEHWADAQGEGDLCLVTWGSTSGIVNEAASRLRESGRPVKTLAIRLLSPLPRDSFLAQLKNVSDIVVIEQNHQGQLFHYLHALSLLPQHACKFAQAGPLPFRPNSIVEFVNQRYANE